MRVTIAFDDCFCQRDARDEFLNDTETARRAEVVTSHTNLRCYHASSLQSMLAKHNIYASVMPNPTSGIYFFDLSRMISYLLS
jgi:hypothetical protein